MAFRSLMILLCVGARYTANAAQNGVLTTHHGATEHGACMLPEASYIVTKPVALGDIGSLGPLKYKTGMCGKILRVDCGNGPLDVIVSNSNLGGGLDLYKSSWNQATRNAQPGQKWCRVELTNHNAIHGHGPRCYYEPSSEKNKYELREIETYFLDITFSSNHYLALVDYKKLRAVRVCLINFCYCFACPLLVNGTSFLDCLTRATKSWYLRPLTGNRHRSMGFSRTWPFTAVPCPQTRVSSSTSKMALRIRSSWEIA